MGPLLFAQLAYAGYQIVRGIKQQRDAKRLAENNIRPTYEGTELYQQLVDKYAYEAQFGLDRNAREFAQQNNNATFTAGLSALLQAGGNANQVAELYGASTSANQGLAIADADRRWQKINALANSINALQEGRNQEFLYNEDGPYKDTARLAAQKQMLGYNQTMAGMDMAVGAIAYDQIGSQQDPPPSPPFPPSNTNNINVNVQQQGFKSVQTGDLFTGNNPVDIPNGNRPEFSTNWTDPSNTGQYVSRNGTVYSPGVVPLSSTAAVPGRNAGNAPPQYNSAEFLTALWQGKVKGYDVNGNPIY